MNTRRTHFVFLFALVLTMLLTYSNHFHNPFHFDDSHSIVTNSYIRDLKNIPLFFTDGATISSNPANQSYRPLTCVSYAIDYKLGGGLSDTFYFQLSTFIWFVLQCFIMYFLFLFWLKKSIEHPWTTWAAMFAVAWYAVHTANAETINYICARTDSLSTMGVVSGMALFVFFPKLRKFQLYLIPVAMGILVKQSALVFAPILLVYVWLFELNINASNFFQSSSRKNLISGIITSIPSFILCIAGYFIVKAMTPETFVPGTVDHFNFAITQPYVSLHYFITYFLPTELSADSDWLPFESVYNWRFPMGVLFVFAMVRIAFIASNKSETRPIAFGILWFFIALLPSSSIVPFAEVMNDHRTFFPYVGLTLACTWTAALIVLHYKDLIFKSKVNTFYFFAFVMLILGGNILGTWERNKVWSSDETLWYDVTVKSPNNGRGLMNYGLSQMSKGNYDDAEKYFVKALERIPNYSYLHVNMGVLKNAQGKATEAENHFKTGLALSPNNPETYYFYGNFLKSQGRGTEAIPLLEQALILSPGHAFSKNLLEEIRLSGASPEDIIKNAEAVVLKDPSADNYLNLSLVYFRAKKFRECIEACHKALEINPQFAAAFNNICSSYNELGEWDKALAACEKAIQIQPDFQLAKNNKAFAEQQLKKK